MAGQSDINYTEKNLEYLSRKLYEAARLDADIEVHNRKDLNALENMALNAFLDKLVEKIPRVENSSEQLKKSLEKGLKEAYKALKDDLKKELKETRVFGVGKNASEKTKTIANNCLKIMSSFVKGISKLALQTVAEDAPKLTDNKTAMRNALKKSSLNLSETKISLKSNQSNTRKSVYHGLS